MSVKKIMLLTIMFLICINVIPSYSQEIDTLKNKLQNVKGIEKLKILNKLAGCYWELPPNERITFANQAFDLANKLNDQKSKADAFNNLGVAYNQLDETQKSLSYFMNALDIAEQVNDKDRIAQSFLNLGQANFYLNHFDKAQEYFQKLLEIRKELGDKQGISMALNHLGNVMAKTKRYDEALDYFSKSLTIRKEINYKMGISQIYNNIANVYFDLGEMNNVLEYRLKSLEIVRELDNKWEIAITTYNIAEYYLYHNEPDKAYPYLLESQDLAEKLDNQGLIRDNLQFFSWYYELIENYPKALEYLKDYAKLTKKQFSEKLSETIVEMQIKYETEKKEKEGQAYKLKLEKSHSEMVQLLFLLTVALFTTFIFYYRYRIKKKSALLLEDLVDQRTHELQQKFHELEQAKQQIQNNLKVKEKLLLELYHRTKNNMQIICSMMNLHALKLDDQKIKAVFQNLDDKIHAMAIVHQKLYESKDLSHVNLKDCLIDILTLVKQSYSELSNQISFLTKMEDINVLVDTVAPLGLVFYELTSNAVQHAFPNQESGEIKVNLYLTPKNEIILDVSDNGIGLPLEFDIKKIIGLGLETAIGLVEYQLGGEIIFETRNGLYCKIVLKKELYKERI